MPYFRMLYIIRKGFYRWTFRYKSYQVTSLDSLDTASLTETHYVSDDYRRLWQWKVKPTTVVIGSENVNAILLQAKYSTRMVSVLRAFFGIQTNRLSHIWEYTKNNELIKSEPRHEKTCLREFATSSDSNRPVQLQRPARVLNFRI